MSEAPDTGAEVPQSAAAGTGKDGGLGRVLVWQLSCR